MDNYLATRVLMLLLLHVVCAVGMPAMAQSDPVLTGMIVAYTDKAESQLKSQERAMAMMSTGHLWMREEYDAVTDYQRQLNDYLDSFRSVTAYAAQIYGFYHEIGRLSDNMGHLADQLLKHPANAFAVALTPQRNSIYRDLILTSVDIVNDIRLVCLSNNKMTEAERAAIVFGIRPKLKLFNKKLQHLTLAVKYTSLADVWREIDLRQRGYEVNKSRISDEAFSRWRGNGHKVRPASGGSQTTQDTPSNTSGSQGSIIKPGQSIPLDSMGVKQKIFETEQKEKR